VDSRRIAYQRLHNQNLWGTPLETPEGVVRWLTAMQSQEFAYAKWSVAQRANNVTAGEISRAFAEGAILSRLTPDQRALVVRRCMRLSTFT
jgi:hypothetical protein